MGSLIHSAVKLRHSPLSQLSVTSRPSPLYFFSIDVMFVAGFAPGRMPGGDLWPQVGHASRSSEKRVFDMKLAEASGIPGWSCCLWYIGRQSPIPREWCYDRRLLLLLLLLLLFLSSFGSDRLPGTLDASSCHWNIDGMPQRLSLSSWALSCCGFSSSPMLAYAMVLADWNALGLLFPLS